jgi:hypothetical protein
MLPPSILALLYVQFVALDILQVNWVDLRVIFAYQELIAMGRNWVPFVQIAQ